MFWAFARFSPAPVGLFSRFWLRGTREALRYTTAHVWIPAGLRGTCSGRSKSIKLASNRGITFRPARANHAHMQTPQVSGGVAFNFSPLPAVGFEVPQHFCEPGYHGRASSFSLCESHERRVCAWVHQRSCAALYGPTAAGTRTQFQEQSLSFKLFFFCVFSFVLAVCCRCCCVPVSHRK